MNRARRRSSAVAGLGLLAMAALAGYANFGIIEHAAEATAQQLAIAALAMAIVAILDVVVAVALVGVLRADAPRSALVAAAIRVVYAACLALAALHLAAPNEPGAARARAFHHIFDPALGLFGVHLLVLALAMARTELAGIAARRVLAAAVAVAGLGYLVDAVSPIILGQSFHVASVTFVGEIALMVWLLVVAVRGARAMPAGAPPN
jgi:hypothetical protein